MSQLAANRTSRQLIIPVRVSQRGPLRTRLALLTAIGLILITLAGAVAANFYQLIYQRFQDVAVSSRIKIQDSDAALQAIAQVSRDAIDAVITASTDPAKSRTAAAAVNTDFASFRQALFKVQGNLASDQENNTFTQAESAVYNDFWPHLTAMLAAQTRGDTANVSVEFSRANTALEQTVIPNLTAVEQDNFATMQLTQQVASGDMTIQLVILTILAAAAALLLTAISFWLRGKLRRYLTLGLDLAVVLAWICGVAMFIDLVKTPTQMKQLVTDSYYGVSATQRILAIATQSYRTESAEILDIPHAKTLWQPLFDQNDALVEQALCGYAGCVNQPFLWLDNPNINSQIVYLANLKLPHDSNTTVPVVPLVANVTYSGEPQAIENIRLAYLDYVTYDSQIRYEVALNLIPQAIILDTGFAGVGFNAFTDAVNTEQQIKADQFDRIWHDIQNTLPTHEILFGIFGYGIAFLCLCVGVYQRYREL